MIDPQVQALFDTCNWVQTGSAPLAGDASARRYVRSINGDASAILMIDPTGSVPSFLKMAAHLQKIGLRPPEIWAADEKAGLILMEDLGDGLLAKIVADDPDQEIPLYRAAVDVLLHLRGQPVPEDIKKYGPQEMADAISPAFEWYAAGQNGSDASALFQEALQYLSPESDTLLLRDYHAENLIWQAPNMRLLDFQDAVAGHPAYDLVSLLQDARRCVSAECIRATTAYYLRETGDDPDTFTAACAVQAAQRNLRILGIFARLSKQGKKHYVDLIPRVWSYLTDNLSHPELARLRAHLMTVLPEPDTAHLNRLKA